MRYAVTSYQVAVRHDPAPVGVGPWCWSVTIYDASGCVLDHCHGREHSQELANRDGAAWAQRRFDALCKEGGVR